MGLSERILELEPGNKMIHEYQALIGMFLRRMHERVEQDVLETELEELAAHDPNGTPSEVFTESEDEAEDDDVAEEAAEGAVSEVETEGPNSAVHSPRQQ